MPSNRIARARRHGEPGLSVVGGTAERLAPPEGLQDYVRSQTCPWCGSGPWKSLGQHTRRAHGVSAAELRAMSGLPSVCSTELSEGSRERLERRPDREATSAKGAAASKIVGAYAVASAVRHAATAEYRGERDADIAARAQRGERLIDIAALYGITKKRCWAILHQMGAVPSNAQVNQERRERLDRNRHAARARLDAKLATATKVRLARFSELGGDWTAVRQVAAEWRISTNAARDWLVKHGISIDG